METILFYLFSTILLGSALIVVSSRNTVYSVFFLILAFLNASGLFVLAHAEFLAMILVIVYVGAVAVLFLFVVMMLNVGEGSSRPLSRHTLFMGLIVAGIFCGELIFAFLTWTTSTEVFALTLAPQNGIENTLALGSLLYTHYSLVFQAVGLILLIAMVGAIVLTLRDREGTRKQKVKNQLARQAKESVQLVELNPEGNSAT